VAALQEPFFEIIGVPSVLRIKSATEIVVADVELARTNFGAYSEKKHQVGIMRTNHLLHILPVNIYGAQQLSSRLMLKATTFVTVLGIQKVERLVILIEGGGNELFYTANIVGSCAVCTLGELTMINIG
jgi:hypothetical protein